MKANKWVVPVTIAVLAVAVVAVSLIVHFKSIALPPPSPTPSAQATSPGEVNASVSGVSLYAQFCESCHGPLATSTKRGHTKAQVQNAISTISAMDSVKNLTSTQIQVIAEALATP